MKAKSKKATAALLCCVLAFLSLAAEFSHHHSLPAGRKAAALQEARTQSESGAGKLAHGYSCQACHFALAQLAVFPAAAMIAAVPSTLLALAALPPSASQFSFQLSSLRAPPAVLA
jgi:hypothetical protein